jgi:1-phosphatidylinositol phosphodiesterase
MEKKSRKHLVLAIVLASITTLVATISFVDPLFSPASKGEEWMSSLPDDRSLTRLSIPGSHDCGARYSAGDLSGKCQDSSISEQLNFGVRFFDVRLYNYNDSLLVCHSFIDENLSLASFVISVRAFLLSHPNEGVLASIKHESHDQGASKDFEALLQEEIAKNPALWQTGRDLPANLGAIRSKITLISRYENNTIGLDAYGDKGWQSDFGTKTTFTLNHLRVQDYYKLSENSAKWSAITSLLSEAEQDTSGSLLYLNFFSGYLTSGFPPTYSMSTAKYINPKVLNNELPSAHYGVLICDFVTPALCQILWGSNL